MTRSAVSPRGPEVAKKVFREKAKQSGMTFKAAILAREAAKYDTKFLSPAGITRRNPGRMDGLTWRSDSIICAEHVDGFELASFTASEALTLDDDDDYSSEEDDYKTSDHTYPQTEVFRPFTVSLLDIARPAKRKGVAKEYEIIEGVRRTIVLDDEDGLRESPGHWVDDDDEWEEIYQETEIPERESYSSILRGNDDG